MIFKPHRHERQDNVQSSFSNGFHGLGPALEFLVDPLDRVCGPESPPKFLIKFVVNKQRLKIFLNTTNQQYLDIAKAESTHGSYGTNSAGAHLQASGAV